MNNLSPPEKKIELFRSLFRGREDVFPRRFESRKTGKSGYQPACANEWVHGLCCKPKVRCRQCPNRKFLPVTDDIIHYHLSGMDVSGRDFVMGLYPLYADETCCFLVVDFDKKSWQEDISAYRVTCALHGIPVAVERSRSGNGGHVWLFFEDPVQSALARKLAAFLLTETMERHPEIGFDSYDRFIPNQDTLPENGFGNLVALPLQKKPRLAGNSLFIDEDFEAWPDQWAFLSSVEKIDHRHAEELVRQAESKGHVTGVRLSPIDEDEKTPWKALPSRRPKKLPLKDLPKHLTLVLGDQIYIAKSSLSPGLRNRLLRLAAFQNPEFYKAQAMRLSTFGKPRIIACAEDHTDHIGLPRGCLEALMELLDELKVSTTIQDERFEGVALDAAFTGTLRPDQLLAAQAVADHDTGVLSATTAFGKTVIGAWLIAKRKVNTLVLVNRRQLLEQWIDRLRTFLDVPPEKIGRIGGGVRKATGFIDVAIIQSLVRKGVVDDLVGDYGQVIMDECHHISAAGYEQLARRVKARFVTGLSATAFRKDGHHPIIFMQCGPIRYRVEPKKEAQKRPFSHTVIVRPTTFVPTAPSDDDVRLQLHHYYRELINDEARNRLICRDVAAAVDKGRNPIVLTERTSHLKILTELLDGSVGHLIVLKGGMGKKKTLESLERLQNVPENENRVILATGKFIGEGFDDARLDTLFLALPISWRGTVAQYAGRLHRLHDRKKEVLIYDYADLEAPMLAKMFERRCKGYEDIGYTLHIPAGASPGWPAEVALSDDPAWKQKFGPSVQRLIRDGVDPSLAGLFQEATRLPFMTNVNGSSRARSASEAFLFQRLESLPQTSGRFKLNTSLPIPFDNQGTMEVDLCDVHSRIAIEIDGPQHLSDPDAYRRDRRKDRLLQENGYLVLRFLAEDIGARLDETLDAIKRSVANRSRD